MTAAIPAVHPKWVGAAWAAVPGAATCNSTASSLTHGPEFDMRCLRFGANRRGLELWQILAISGVTESAPKRMVTKRVVPGEANGQNVTHCRIDR
jgi:hypothetical protein